MAKQKTLEEIYPMVENLSTADQKALKEYIEKTLKAKAEKASEELELING